METSLPSSSVALLRGGPVLVNTRKMLVSYAQVGDFVYSLDLLCILISLVLFLFFFDLNNFLSELLRKKGVFRIFLILAFAFSIFFKCLFKFSLLFFRFISQHCVSL